MDKQQCAEAINAALDRLLARAEEQHRIYCIVHDSRQDIIRQVFKAQAHRTASKKGTSPPEWAGQEDEVWAELERLVTGALAPWPADWRKRAGLLPT